jgi:hypothetical protein
MGLYEGVKDAIALAQKADNIELYRQLLDLGAQALEMQDEIRILKEENAELKKVNDLESKIIRHDQPYITFSDDEKEIMYCASCWGNNKKTIQLRCNHNDGTFQCPICKTHDIYDEEKYIKTSRIITSTAF